MDKEYIDIFDDLDFDRQCDIVSSSPLSEKADLIIRSQNPRKMIHALAPEELFLISRETETEILPDLLRYANLGQLLFMGDMHCWKKDTVHPQGFLGFLEELMEADIDKLAEWFSTIESELLTAGFMKVISVIKAQDTEDIVEDRLGERIFFTIDGYYYISVAESNFDIVRTSLEILYSTNPHIYINLFESIICESLYESEEIAYVFRQERLSEKGFPDPEEAYRIYKPLSAEEWQLLEKKETAPSKDMNKSDVSKKGFSFLKLQTENQFFVDDVLLSLQGEDVSFRDDFQQEFLGITNKIISALGLEHSHEEDIKKAIEQTHRFVNIGLEDLSGKDLHKARDILHQYWLEHIFRWGLSKINVVRESAIETYKLSRFNDKMSFFNFFEPPLDGVFSGILLKIPKYYPSMSPIPDFELRDFQTIDEVTETGRIVTGTSWVLTRLNSISPNWRTFCNDDDYDEISINKIIVTMFIRFVASGKPALDKVSLKQFKSFLTRCDSYKKKKPGEQELTQRNDFIRVFSDHHNNLYGSAIINSLLSKSREEYVALSPNKDIEPQYLSFLLLEKKRKKVT